MRVKDTRNGIRIKAYAGTTGVLLAMNVTDHKRDGLLGFAIEREGPGDRHRWLRGLLRFPGEGGEILTPIDSKDGPIQKFRWSDYSVYPDTTYRYRVHGVYGAPGNLRYKQGGEVSVTTESLTEGLHQVVFNRAAAASQAYRRRFGNANPDEPGNERARAWLSRGLYQKLLDFIDTAQDDSWALDMAIYEIELDDVVEHLRAAHERGAHVRVVYHARKDDHQTEVNEQCLAPLPDDVKRGRVTSSIFHQKFIVLSRMGQDGERRPVAVLSGTTNFTPNGVYRQANVIHVVEDPALAAEYLALFELLFGGGDARQTKRYINAQDPVTRARMQVLFSPRSDFTDLAEVNRLLTRSRSDLIFCTAFQLHPLVMQGLAPEQPDDVIRYGLQNSRSQITGFHRHSTFVTKAFLKEGLEGFLKESTAGQRGNILIHLKTIVIDFTTRRPVVISGSNNLSKPGSSKNDENMLIIRSDTSAADTYMCELFRLYDHYRFRFNQTSNTGRGTTERLSLATTDSWTDPYFVPDSLKELERIRFNR